MTPVSREEAKVFFTEFFAEPLRAIGREGEDLPDDFDFLIEGVMDSLGLLEMISALEESFGLELDLESLEAQELTKLGPLCRVVEQQSREAGSVRGSGGAI